MAAGYRHLSLSFLFPAQHAGGSRPFVKGRGQVETVFKDQILCSWPFTSKSKGRSWSLPRKGTRRDLKCVEVEDLNSLSFKTERTGP